MTVLLAPRRRRRRGALLERHDHVYRERKFLATLIRHAHLLAPALS
jgi:hypothetical protein